MHKSVKITAVASALAVSGIALAHHGWSSYDAETTIQHTAPVSELSWGNPHGMAKVRYQDKSWDVVLAPISRMEQRGLTREMMAPDKPVTLVGYPRRDGTPEMRIERVIVGEKTIELR